MTYPKPANEERRLAALQRYHILDTAQELAFDDFARLASLICGTPTAVVSLVDADRQWFKASVGMELTETPRKHAFCSYTILGEETMVVENATADQRFSANPYVTSNPYIRFYAGSPLIDSEGNALGSLCVIDRKPRTLPPEQREALEALARQIIAQLELRRSSAELALALQEVKALHGLLPLCSHCKGVRNDEGYWENVDAYLRSHTEAEISHGICPTCFETHYPEIFASRGNLVVAAEQAERAAASRS